VEIDKAEADIEHKQAQTIKTEVDAAKAYNDIELAQFNALKGLMDNNVQRVGE
jgi:hypothetical protein